MRQKRCIVIGNRGVGKTSLFLQFAYSERETESLRLRIHDLQNGGKWRIESFTKETAFAKLTAGEESEYPVTDCIQSINLTSLRGANHPSFWAENRFSLRAYDTPGLCEGVYDDFGLRKQIAGTFRLLFQSDVVLHVISAPRVGKFGTQKGLGEVDLSIQKLANPDIFAGIGKQLEPLVSDHMGNNGKQSFINLFANGSKTTKGSNCDNNDHPRVFIVANKMDLPWATVGYHELKEMFSQRVVIPVCATKDGGLRKLKRVVFSDLF